MYKAVKSTNVSKREQDILKRLMTGVKQSYHFESRQNKIDNILAPTYDVSVWFWLSCPDIQFLELRWFVGDDMKQKNRQNRPRGLKALAFQLPRVY